MDAPSSVCPTVEVASGNIYYCEDYSWRHNVFRDRVEAGILLAKFISQLAGGQLDVVVGLVAGGVPVAYSISRELGIPMDVVVVKKITYPWTTEAGFGAVAPDGLYEFDREAAKHARLSLDYVGREARRVHNFILARTLKLRGSMDYSNLEGKKVVLVDDGIATGYTMIVAVKFLRRIGVKEVVVATPTASIDGALITSKEADKLLVLNLRTGPFYAVADAYIEWHDVSDEEAIQYIKQTTPINPRR